jgi:hypothetical protein
MQIFSSKKTLVQFALGLFINIMQKIPQKNINDNYTSLFYFILKLK